VVVFFRKECNICKTLLGFRIDENGELVLAVDTPFRRACRRFRAMTGRDVVALCINASRYRDLLLAVVRRPIVELPCAVGNPFGFWPGPIHPFLREEVYLDVLLGRRRPIVLGQPVPEKLLLPPEEIMRVVGHELAEGAEEEGA